MTRNQSLKDTLTTIKCTNCGQDIELTVLAAEHAKLARLLDVTNSDASLTNQKGCWQIAMKILIFTEGTILMHAGTVGHNREEVVRQVVENDPTVKNYATYIPIGIVE
jgi:hypothetical protein